MKYDKDTTLLMEAYEKDVDVFDVNIKRILNSYDYVNFLQKVQADVLAAHKNGIPFETIRASIVEIAQRFVLDVTANIQPKG
jgi:hypothetical protein